MHSIYSLLLDVCWQAIALSRYGINWNEFPKDLSFFLDHNSHLMFKVQALRLTKVTNGKRINVATLLYGIMASTSLVIEKCTIYKKKNYILIQEDLAVCLFLFFSSPFFDRFLFTDHHTQQPRATIYLSVYSQIWRMVHVTQMVVLIQAAG